MREARRSRARWWTICAAGRVACRNFIMDGGDTGLSENKHRSRKEHQDVLIDEIERRRAWIERDPCISYPSDSFVSVSARARARRPRHEHPDGQRACRSSAPRAERAETRCRLCIVIASMDTQDCISASTGAVSCICICIKSVPSLGARVGLQCCWAAPQRVGRGSL